MTRDGMPRKGPGIRKQLQVLGLVPALFMLGLLLVALTWQRFEDADRDLRELGRFLAQQIASASEYGVLAGNFKDSVSYTHLTLPTKA